MSARLQLAVVRATAWHDGQWRDGDHPLPYITHPLEVLTLLREVGEVTDEDLLCAAVLHDVLEETQATREGLEADFGPRVAHLVGQLTRVEPDAHEIDGLSKEEVWQFRADRLLGEIAAMDPEAWPVKLADRAANLRQAILVKKGTKLSRYTWQSERILEIIPRSANRGLWTLIQATIERAQSAKGYRPYERITLDREVS